MLCAIGGLVPSLSVRRRGAWRRCTYHTFHPVFFITPVLLIFVTTRTAIFIFLGNDHIPNIPLTTLHAFHNLHHLHITSTSHVLLIFVTTRTVVVTFLSNDHIPSIPLTTMHTFHNLNITSSDALLIFFITWDKEGEGSHLKRVAGRGHDVTWL
jgi:hypothetical protein